MIIILNLTQGLEYSDGKAILKELSENPESLRKEIFNYIEGEFDGDCRTGDVYLYEDTRESCFVFGAVAPETMRGMAVAWNLKIQTELLDAVSDLKAVKEHDATLMPTNTDVTYRVRKAANEVDDHWTPFGAHGILLENEVGYTYFSCLMQPKWLLDIQKHPENYVVVYVMPK